LTERVWYKWPQGYYNKSYKPGYVIARGLLALPFMLVAFSLFYLTVLVGWGFDIAEDFRKEVF
jgi:hypothetical protein